MTPIGAHRSKLVRLGAEDWGRKARASKCSEVLVSVICRFQSIVRFGHAFFNTVFHIRGNARWKTVLAVK